MQWLVSAHTTDLVGCLAKLFIGIKQLVHLRKCLFLPSDSSTICPPVFLGVSCILTPLFVSAGIGRAHADICDRSWHISKWGPLFNSALAHLSLLEHPSRGPVFVEVSVLATFPCVTLVRGGGSAQCADSLRYIALCLSVGAEAALPLNPWKFMPAVSCFQSWTENVTLLLFSPVWLFLLSMQVNTSGDRIRGNVDYSHTWGLNCVCGNEWTGFCWHRQGLRSGWRVHLTAILESIFKALKALKCYHLMKSFNLCFILPHDNIFWAS